MALRHDALDAGLQARVLLVEDDARAATLTAEMLRCSWPEGLVLAHAVRLTDATRERLEGGTSCVLLALSGDRDQSLAALEQHHTAAPEGSEAVQSVRVEASVLLGKSRPWRSSSSVRRCTIRSPGFRTERCS